MLLVLYSYTSSQCVCWGHKLCPLCEDCTLLLTLQSEFYQDSCSTGTQGAFSSTVESKARPSSPLLYKFYQRHTHEVGCVYQYHSMVLILLVQIDLHIQYSTRLVIKRLQVWVPAEAAGEFSSPELTFCADSHLVPAPPYVTTVACKRPRAFCQKFR